LIGPDSEGIIYKILKSITNSCSFSDVDTSLNEEVFTRNLHFMMENQVLIFKVRKPTSRFRMNEFIFNTINNLIITEEKQGSAFGIMNTNSGVMTEINENDYNTMVHILKYKSVTLDSLKEFDNDVKVDIDIDIPTERTVY
jgi:hypothetical protein